MATFCDICNKKIDLWTLSWNTADGIICPSCCNSYACKIGKANNTQALLDMGNLSTHQVRQIITQNKNNSITNKQNVKTKTSKISNQY